MEQERTCFRLVLDNLVSLFMVSDLPKKFSVFKIKYRLAKLKLKWSVYNIFENLNLHNAYLVLL